MTDTSHKHIRIASTNTSRPLCPLVVGSGLRGQCQSKREHLEIGLAQSLQQISERRQRRVDSSLCGGVYFELSFVQKSEDALGYETR